jgi:hypothetical protein
VVKSKSVTSIVPCRSCHALYPLDGVQYVALGRDKGSTTPGYANSSPIEQPSAELEVSFASGRPQHLQAEAEGTPQRVFAVATTQ